MIPPKQAKGIHFFKIILVAVLFFPLHLLPRMSWHGMEKVGGISECVCTCVPAVVGEHSVVWCGYVP